MEILTLEQIQSLSFEEALKQLEANVKLLEDGGLQLDAAVCVFEEGDRLRKHCESKLREAKLNVENVIASTEAQAADPVLAERACA